MKLILLNWHYMMIDLQKKNLNNKFKKMLKFINYINTKLNNHINYSNINRNKLQEKLNNVIKSKITADEFFTHEFKLSFVDTDELKNKLDPVLYKSLLCNIPSQEYIMWSNNCANECKVYTHKNKNY